MAQYLVYGAGSDIQWQGMYMNKNWNITATKKKIWSSYANIMVLRLCITGKVYIKSTNFCVLKKVEIWFRVKFTRVKIYKRNYTYHCI